ncbi:sugar phosphate isomerase/epimerase family protein [Hyunsoonleella aestuarii]|uniref:Xylose isomerase-like TIM barrel domain-containing protein n=1 Tax=Hyunsoonleella aestuarii TaxID=912802 RepID=A0ABP8EEH9_9FLAO|nr:sugar phosphate isomerase/epimerase [Hyunsoonleella aestuarii]
MFKLNKFGVQSYCFRNYKDNAVVAKKVREIGLDSIEICEVHADFNDLANWKEVIKIYESHNISIVSIGVQTFVGNDKERLWFECAATAGAKYISAHFEVDSFQKAIPKVKNWCDEFGIKVGLHCHGGYKFAGSNDVIDYLLKLGGPQIGLCLDTGWAMQIGPEHGNPLDWVKRYGDKIYGVHFKDFTFDSNAQWRDVVIGKGNLPLREFVQTLDKINFNGVAVIEYEANTDNPVSSLQECVKNMKNCLV